MSTDHDFRADLHIHSTFSDGTLTPEEIVLLAKEIGLKGLSITDHDTIEAYDTLFDLGRSHGMEILSGVEFSSYCQGQSVHVLGYNFDVQNQALGQFCLKHQERRKKRNLAMLARLEEMGMPVTEEEILVYNHKSTGRPHIALAMIKRGYVESVQEAFNLYLGDNKQCFVQGEMFSVEETISIIREAGGIAVIAHPHLISPSSLLHQVLKISFDGIECWYSRFTPDQESRWIEIANKRNWIKTGGSDFHGSVKPQTPLGCSWVDREHFEKVRHS